jgi:hypothetical protein
VEGIHKGYFRRAIAEASYPLRTGRWKPATATLSVSTPTPYGNEDHQVEILEIPHTVETEQCDRLAKFKENRSADGREKRRSMRFVWLRGRIRT